MLHRRLHAALPECTLRLEKGGLLPLQAPSWGMGDSIAFAWPEVARVTAIQPC